MSNNHIHIWEWRCKEIAQGLMTREVRKSTALERLLDDRVMPKWIIPLAV